MTKEEYNELLQIFTDESHSDPQLQTLIDEYIYNYNLTGIKDSLILTKIFDYLDANLQGRIRRKLHEIKSDSEIN